MILLWLFKIGGLIRTVAEFILTHWKAFLLLAMVWAIFFYKTAYEREKRAYEAHIQADITAKQMRLLENSIKQKQQEKQVAQLLDTHNKKLDLVKNEYLKRTKQDSIAIADLRQRLRDQLATDTASGLSGVESNPERTAEEWRNSYSAISKQYQTLKDACTITTLDYDALRSWADSACDTVQCK